jgi:hypothetical protein
MSLVCRERLGLIGFRVLDQPGAWCLTRDGVVVRRCNLREQHERATDTEEEARNRGARLWE